MKQIYRVSILLCLLVSVMPSFAQKKKGDGKARSEYVVLASQSVQKDAAWMQVVDALKKKHNAEVFFYEKAPRENLADLQRVRPRYVAIVEKPENLGRDYVIDMHHVSREVDEDIFADFLWGIITGYDADAAMKMVNNSTEPLLVKDAVATIMELNSAKWFDNYAWVDDHNRGLWGEKKGRDAKIQTAQIDPKTVLKKFTDIYAEYNPDLVVTAAHATERNLEMPFSLGNIMAKDGKLYARDHYANTTWDLKESGKRKVYFAVGNCLIGNVNNTKESMAIAWMNSGNAATMIGYVVTTWHGRNGWGGLKYWVTNPGRYTLSEAIYMNQQDFLYQQNEWYPSLIKENYNFDGNEFQIARQKIAEVIKGQPTKDQIGFWHDRDVLAYYGDPKWEVRLQEVPGEMDFTVTSKVKGKKCIITIKTNENFSLERMKGDKFKEEHVLDLPFNYFFPERLNNPRLAAGQNWKAAVDENFLIIYNPEFKPNSTYEVVLDIDK
jgi:peptidase M16 domain protein